MPPRRVSFVTLSKRKQENPRKLLPFGGMDDTKTSKCPVRSSVPTPAPTKSNIQAMEELLQMAKITKAQQPKKWAKFAQQEEKMRSYSRPTVTRSSQPSLQNMERLAKIRGGKKIHQIQKLRELAQLSKNPKKEKSSTYRRLKDLDTPLAIPKSVPMYSRPTATKITPSKTISEKMAKVRAARKTTRVAKVKGVKKIKQIQTLRELAQLPKKQRTYKRLQNLDTPKIIVSKKPKPKPKPVYSRPTVTRVAPSKAMSEKMAKVRAARKTPNKMNQMQRLRRLAKLPKSQPTPKSKTKYKRLKNLDQVNKN